jgi:hypothetical protein
VTLLAPDGEGQPYTLDLSKRTMVGHLQRVLAGEPPKGGGVWGFPELPPGDIWVPTVGAIVVTGRPARQITAYIAKGGPKSNPFPIPHTFMRRSFWKLSELRAWVAREDAQLHGGTRPHHTPKGTT